MHEQHQTILALTRAVGPATAYFARQPFDQANREACQPCLDLLCYARSFTPARVERAALRLMDYGNHDVVALRFLLGHDLDVLVHRAHTQLDGQLSLDLTGTESSRKA